MADNLKPCPFCGGEADIKDGDIIAGHQYHMAYCYSCGARSVPCSSEEGAIEAWNNRPSPWHTGTPQEEGWYLLKYEDGFYCANYWNGGGWKNQWCGTLLKWQKIEED